MRYILVVLALCSFAISAQAGTFRDDFEDGDLEGWRQEFPVAQTPTLWKIVDGELECSRPVWLSTILVTGKEQWKDYTIEYEVKLLQDLGLGDVDVMARYKNIFTYTMFVGIGDPFGAQVIFTERLPGNIITQKPFDLELNQWHHLKLEVKGEKFTFWVNGKMVLEHKDDVVKEGAVGLGLANYTAHFDNVEISGPDVPDVTPPTWKAKSVQPHKKTAMTWGTIKSIR